jgi:hypothetical protein
MNNIHNTMKNIDPYIWQYECPIWTSHFKDNTLFGLLPPELVKIIISNIIDSIKIRIKQQILVKNMQQIKSRIYTIFNKNQENFHFEKDIICDMDIVKSILSHTAKKQNKPIEISHICCSGKGIVFEYINNEPNDKYMNKINYNNDIRKKYKKKIKL